MSAIEIERTYNYYVQGVTKLAPQEQSERTHKVNTLENVTDIEGQSKERIIIERDAENVPFHGNMSCNEAFFLLLIQSLLNCMQQRRHNSFVDFVRF